MSKKQKGYINDYIKATYVRAARYQVFLDGPIQSAPHYRDLTYLLMNASENDLIDFIINSPGGHLDAAMQIIEGIRMSDANVQCTLVGQCHSAASMIALSCPAIFVSDSANALIHQATFGTGGVVGNVKAHSDFTSVQMDKILNDLYCGFMNAKEIQAMKDGKEFWFNSDEIRTRAQARMDYLTKQQKKIEKELKQ